MLRVLVAFLSSRTIYHSNEWISALSALRRMTGPQSLTFEAKSKGIKDGHIDGIEWEAGITCPPFATG